MSEYKLAEGIIALSVGKRWNGAKLERALNAEAVDHAHRRGWIDDPERNSYFNTMRRESAPPGSSEAYSD